MNEAEPTVIARRHLIFGWWALLGFLSLGILLESMHGFKLGWYLDVGNETRRLMLRLAHAHGTLLAVINLVFALCVQCWKSVPARASICLILSNFLIPGGFFIGGLVFYGGDPGYGILLVPLGALCLFIGVLLTAIHFSRK